MWISEILAKYDRIFLSQNILQHTFEYFMYDYIILINKMVSFPMTPFSALEMPSSAVELSYKVTFGKGT